MVVSPMVTHFFSLKKIKYKKLYKKKKTLSNSMGREACCRRR
jgi:hypothetical protein